MSDRLMFNGIGRDAENDHCLVVYLNRRATDHDIGLIHDLLKDPAPEDLPDD